MEWSWNCQGNPTTARKKRTRASCLKSTATSYGLKAERNVQQMVRIPKGDNKSTSKVTWKPRQSSPVCLWKWKSAACPCMLSSHALIHRKKAIRRRGNASKSVAFSVSHQQGLGYFWRRFKRACLFVCLFLVYPKVLNILLKQKSFHKGNRDGGLWERCARFIWETDGENANKNQARRAAAGSNGNERPNSFTSPSCESRHI